jgi:hypothetical protein
MQRRISSQPVSFGPTRAKITIRHATGSAFHISAALAWSLLRRKVANRFPSYRLPLVTDNLDEDVRAALLSRKDGCLSVATRDFDGDGVTDFAIGLTPKRGAIPLVVVALSRQNTWLFSTLRSWGDQRMRLYVDVVSAGVYARARSLDTSLEPGESAKLRCASAGVVVGAKDSTEIVYCHVNKRWIYVWVSD